MFKKRNAQKSNDTKIDLDKDLEEI